MKSYVIVFFALLTVVGCAKKVTQSSNATSQPAAVNEVKPPADIPKEAAKKMESPQVTAGKEIYTTKCARCHGAKKVDDYTVQEWIPIMDRMAPKARLTDTEKSNVTAYVNFYAKN